MTRISLQSALFATGALAAVACGDDTTSPTAASNNDLRNAFSHGTCQGSGVVRYAASPMAVADAGQFIPMGVMTGGHVTPVHHQYPPPLDLSAGRTRYNVYAPFPETGSSSGRTAMEETGPEAGRIGPATCRSRMETSIPGSS